MNMQGKKVIVVKQGHLVGAGQEDEYEPWVELVRRATEDGGAEVKLLQIFNEAQGLLEKEEASALVFISMGMLSAARVAKDKYPRLRVVIFTGSLPEPDEERFKGLILVDKVKTTDSKSICEAILGT